MNGFRITTYFESSFEFKTKTGAVKEKLEPARSEDFGLLAAPKPWRRRACRAVSRMREKVDGPFFAHSEIRIPHFALNSTFTLSLPGHRRQISHSDISPLVAP
jgi:hypothetical protein